MKILDILTSPWAIQPDKLLEIQAIYATHLRGEKIDIAGIEAKLGRPLANEQKPYEVVDGVAIVDISGVLAKRMNLFSQISGGASMQIIERDMRMALNDSSVHSIILAIDSPGGTVDGTQGLADFIVASRDIKPIVTLSDGVMASAAYWIGSAASKAYISNSTVAVGSIGVVASHVDVSRREEQMGIKTTEIYAGKFKRIASQYAPLSEEGKQSIQDQVDYLYSLFVGAVAKNRNVSEEKVLQDMADGRVLVGQQAIDAGLVDGVSTLQGLIAQLNEGRAGVAQNSQNQSKGANMLTKEQIIAEAPELAAAFRAEGASSERDRIQSVRAQAIPGHEALIDSLAFDGTTTGPEAAVQILNAERALKEKAVADLAGAAPAAVAFAAAPADDVTENLPPEEQAKAEWDKSSTLRAEFGDNFKTYAAYREAESTGRVKVAGKKG
jgi:signal peptide peptidase SppA